MHSLARRALHTCNVPRDLNPVTFCDTAGEHPDRVGLDSNAAEAVWRSVEALYRTGVHPGIQLSLRYRGGSRYCTGRSGTPGGVMVLTIRPRCRAFP